MNLTYFKELDLVQSTKRLFEELGIPLIGIGHSHDSRDILEDTWKENETFQLIEKVTLVGSVDADFLPDGSSNALSGLDSLKSKDYGALLIFSVSLFNRRNNLLPTRSQLTELSRAFNREFKHYPVVVVFRYSSSNKDYIAFSHAQRSEYKHKWRDGEKIGKVTLLRDINIAKTHRGHVEILNRLSIENKKLVSSLKDLINYWEKQFNVQVLNETFYRDLSNWYFWALKHVTFPNEPSSEVAYEKGIDKNYLIQEQKSINLIRLITRLLFTWFIKQKGLIPDELFNLDLLKEQVLKDYNPSLSSGLIFKDDDKSSTYYRAILQNLFFATLNCPINGNEHDKRKRGFRSDNYGVNRGANHLLRYKDQFRNPNKFLELLNNNVPFLNGGLFECLDEKNKNIYVDGFSDGMAKGEQLIVPDFLFFGREEKTDLSSDYGIETEGTTNADVKGIINIFRSYVFTVSENTPLDEEIALDPELLGRVFENLLASLNPETKKTARKKTGSFYTPREIVSYMVDKSLKVTFKNSIEEYQKLNGDKTILELDRKLDLLINWSESNPFESNHDVVKIIVKTIDRCKILDPACGSGAFPMGILQKLIHILKKLDPENLLWKEIQLDKANTILKDAMDTTDRADREEKINEIHSVFDDHINDPDYARKLYIIENGIFGVDIQPIATQIARLRFFISLIIDQKIDNSSDNFGIQPLPNLESNFVSANVLNKINLDDFPIAREEIFPYRERLKVVRSKHFNAKSPTTKIKYQREDKEIRHLLENILITNNFPAESAERLAKWDPYDLTKSSSFFDSEWMFGVSCGFDIVIGNPPYIQSRNMSQKTKLSFKQNFKSYHGDGDIYFLFFERGIQLTKNKGLLCYITSNKWLRVGAAQSLRSYFSELNPLFLIDFGGGVFKSASVDTNILLIENRRPKEHKLKVAVCNNPDTINNSKLEFVIKKDLGKENWVVLSKAEKKIKEKIDKLGIPLRDWNVEINIGVMTGCNEAFIINNEQKDRFIKKDPKSVEIIRPILRGKDIRRYGHDLTHKWLINSHNGIVGKYDRVDINDFPTIKNHLDQFIFRLTKRTSKGNTPYNLRSCKYIDNFYKQKIVWQEISKKPKFHLDNDGFIILNSALMMVGDYSKYLTGYLNSKVAQWYFKLICTELDGTNRWLKYTISKLPVIDINLCSTLKQIEGLVIEIQESKQYIDPQNQKTIENKIDDIIYKAFNLSKDEVELIENGLI